MHIVLCFWWHWERNVLGWEMMHVIGQQGELFQSYLQSLIILWKTIKKILNNQTQTKPFLLIINLYTDLGNLISNDFYIFISYFYPSLGNCIYHNYAFINTLTDKSQHNSLEIKFFCVFLFSFKNYFTRTVNKMLECLIKWDVSSLLLLLFSST